MGANAELVSTRAAAADDGRANILIVDDRSDKLLVFKTILEDLDQNIITLQSGEDALRWLLDNDLVERLENHEFEPARVLQWRGRKLGYVPRRENAALAWGLDRGTELRARVSRLSDHPNPARRIEFEVYIE